MMPTPDTNDPFLQVQSDVLQTLHQTRPLLQSYLRIRTTPNLPPQNPELASARTELESALATLADDLADLVASVQAVEGDPTRFGLDNHEVERRRQLVREVGSEVEGMRAQVVGSVSGGTGDSIHTGNGGKSSGGGALPDPSHFTSYDDDEHAGGEDEGSYEAFEMQRQQQLLHEQDEALDGVFRTVGNLRHQANEMGRELEEQGVLLDEVDTLADRVGGKLIGGVKRIANVVRQNEDKRRAGAKSYFFAYHR